MQQALNRACCIVHKENRAENYDNTKKNNIGIAHDTGSVVFQRSTGSDVHSIYFQPANY